MLRISLIVLAIAACLSIDNTAMAFHGCGVGGCGHPIARHDARRGFVEVNVARRGIFGRERDRINVRVGR